MSQSRALLDIDDSILTKNLILPENQKQNEDIDQLFRSIDKPQQDMVPSVVARPKPGYCIKVKTETGEKVFINICHMKEIPPPDDLSDEKLLKVMDDMIPSYVIPMSIGNGRMEADKGGQPCWTYDVALNSTYYEKCQNNKIFLHFTIMVALDAVSEKFDKVFVGKDYVILKNRKVVGTLQDHRIQKREPRKPEYFMAKKPLIEEIDRVPGSSKSSSPDTFPVDYVLFSHPKSGTPKYLIGQFNLPRMTMTESVEVDVGEDRIVVETGESRYTLDIFIPHAIQPQNAKAFIDRKIGGLQLVMPLA